MNESANRYSRPRPAGSAWRQRMVRAGAASALCALLMAGQSAVWAGSVNYTYDTLGRLATLVYNNGVTTTTLTYSYDAAGNRTSVVTTSP